MAGQGTLRHRRRGPKGRTRAEGTFRAWLSAARPKQWSKNLLLFVALVFAGTLTDAEGLVRASVGFAVFVAISAAGYLVNDLVDLELDRRHPIKSRRPLASGRIPASVAKWVIAVLTGISLSAAWALGLPFLMATLGFLVINLSYSAFLKGLVFADVLTLSVGYPLRAAAGALAVGVHISPWLLAVTFSGASFIALSKRHSELVLLGSDALSHRSVLGIYTSRTLRLMLAFAASTTAVIYVSYATLSSQAEQIPGLALTIAPVVWGLARYTYLVLKKGEGGSPEDLLVADPQLRASIAIWLGLTLVAIYVIG